MPARSAPSRASRSTDQPAGPTSTSSAGEPASWSRRHARTTAPRFLRGSTVPTHSTYGAVRRWRARVSATSSSVATGTSTHHGTTAMRSGSMPWAATSTAVVCDGHTTTSASRRVSSNDRWNSRRPRRVKAAGLASQSRSWTVTTRGWRAGGTTMPDAHTTSTSPDAQRTGGHRRPCHASYSRVRGSGRASTGTGGTNDAAGGRRWNAETPVSRRSVWWTRAARVPRVEVAVPPGTRCQHCSTVTATRRPSRAEVTPPGPRPRRGWRGTTRGWP